VHKIALEDGLAVLIPAAVFYGLTFIAAIGLSATANRRAEVNNDEL
jgi:hypothetical protein